jgi:predicted HD phosphohydrolase
LCSVDAEYKRQLSATSIQSLALQGGPMSDDEVRDFEASAYASEGVRLRRWDDLAKMVGLKTPELSQYQSMLERIVNRCAE